MRPVAALILFLAATAPPLAFAQQGDIERYKHLGAASCASSVCHGKIAPQPGRNVGLNEYGIWVKEDVHSRAYHALESALSKRIATNMGIGKPTTEKICLDCHADNVPKGRRGPKFQLSDGVSCEGCHGGSEKWIESHAVASRTHRDNVADGMYQSELPVQRAQLCLSCHLGTKDKFATHLMMAAGHPRLAFELEAYTTNEPAHFTVDADYKQRKGTIAGMNLWLTGQIESARALLTLQRSDLLHPSAMVPEFSLFDCHSCHHPMDRQRGTRPPATTAVKPGTLRLQTQNLVVIGVALEKLEPQAQADAARLTNAVVNAGQRDVAAVSAAAGAAIDWLKGREALARRQFSRADVLEVRKLLLRHAATDQVVDYAVAEQIVLGVESLSHSVGDYRTKKALLDKLYAVVKDGTTFSPSHFASAAKAALAGF